MTSTPQNQRFAALDIAKGLGIILIVYSHLGDWNNTAGLVLMGLFSYMLMFYFFASGYPYKPGKRGVRENMARRAKQILLPYIKYSVGIALICGGYLCIAGELAPVDAMKQLAEVWLGARLNEMLSLGLPTKGVMIGIMNPFWFMSQMFLSSMLFYLVADFALKRISRAIATAIGLCALSSVLLILFPNKLPWNLQATPAFCAVMLLGALAGMRKLFTVPPLKGLLKWASVAAAAVLAALFNVWFPGVASLAGGTFGKLGGWGVFPIVLQGLLGSYSFIFLCTLIARVDCLKRAFSWIGARTVPILLLHVPFSYFIGRWTGFTVGLTARWTGGEPVHSAVITLAAFGLTLVCCVIWLFAAQYVNTRMSSS